MEPRCEACDGGEEQLERAAYGYGILFFLVAAVGAFFIYKIVKRFQEERANRLWTLASRRMDSLKMERIRFRHRRQLYQIKPQLDLIANRLRSSSATSGFTEVDADDGGSVPSSRAPVAVSIAEGGSITFDAKMLFDQVDKNNDGVLTYDELNTILQLDPVQLQEFVRRMNNLGGERSQKTVSRAVFCKHFVKVLATTTHFRPTAEEAAVLFDEIAEEHGTNRFGDIELEKL